MLISKGSNGLMAILGFSLLMLVGLIIDLRVIMSQISKEKTQLLDFIAQHKTNQLLLSESEIWKKRWDELSQSRQIFNEEKMSLTSALFHLYSLAQLSGLTVRLIKPAESKQFLNKKVRVIEISMVGTLAQMDLFFDELTQSSLPLLATQFDLYRHVDGTWRILLTLMSFSSESFSNDVKSVDAQFEDLLTIFSPSQMRFVGIIEQGSIRWALVKLPNEKTMPVQIGTILGPEKNTIIDIQEHCILLKNHRESIHENQTLHLSHHDFFVPH